MSARYQKGSLEPVTGVRGNECKIPSEKHMCFRIKYKEINVQVKEEVHKEYFLLW